MSPLLVTAMHHNQTAHYNYMSLWPTLPPADNPAVLRLHKQQTLWYNVFKTVVYPWLPWLCSHKPEVDRVTTHPVVKQVTWTATCSGLLKVSHNLLTESDHKTSLAVERWCKDTQTKKLNKTILTISMETGTVTTRGGKVHFHDIRTATVSEAWIKHRITHRAVINETTWSFANSLLSSTSQIQ